MRVSRTAMNRTAIERPVSYSKEAGQFRTARKRAVSSVDAGYPSCSVPNVRRRAYSRGRDRASSLFALSEFSPTISAIVRSNGRPVINATELIQGVNAGEA